MHNSETIDGDLSRLRGRADLLIQSVTGYAIYMMDRQGVVASWNAGAERLKGYTADEIIGRNFSTFYEPADRRNKVPQKALRTAETDGRFEAEGWRVRKDGSRFWASVVIESIRSDEGTLLGFAKSPATLPIASGPRRTCDVAKSASECWWKASPTTPSTCWPRTA